MLLPCSPFCPLRHKVHRRELCFNSRFGTATPPEEGGGQTDATVSGWVQAASQLKPATVLILGTRLSFSTGDETGLPCGGDPVAQGCLFRDLHPCPCLKFLPFRTRRYLRHVLRGAPVGGGEPCTASFTSLSFDIATLSFSPSYHINAHTPSQ